MSSFFKIEDSESFLQQNDNQDHHSNLHQLTQVKFEPDSQEIPTTGIQNISQNVNDQNYDRNSAFRPVNNSINLDAFYRNLDASTNQYMNQNFNFPNQQNASQDNTQQYYANYSNYYPVNNQNGLQYSSNNVTSNEYTYSYNYANLSTPIDNINVRNVVNPIPNYNPQQNHVYNQDMIQPMYVPTPSTNIDGTNNNLYATQTLIPIPKQLDIIANKDGSSILPPSPIVKQNIQPKKSLSVSPMPKKANQVTTNNDSELEIKLRLKRERNRLAARKCRNKKFTQIEEFSKQIETLSKEIQDYKSDIDTLIMRKTEMRAALLNSFCQKGMLFKPKMKF